MGTDCGWGPEAGIITSSDAPFSGLGVHRQLWKDLEYWQEEPATLPPPLSQALAAEKSLVSIWIQQALICDLGFSDRFPNGDSMLKGPSTLL